MSVQFILIVGFQDHGKIWGNGDRDPVRNTGNAAIFEEREKGRRSRPIQRGKASVGSQPFRDGLPHHRLAARGLRHVQRRRKSLPFPAANPEDQKVVVLKGPRAGA